MNKNVAVQELDEMIVHAKDLIAEILNGDYDEDGEVAYSIDLSHLMDHLVRAWHYAKMSDEQVADLSQDDFEKLTYAIPKFDIQHRLVEPYEKII